MGPLVEIIREGSNGLTDLNKFIGSGVKYQALELSDGRRFTVTRDKRPDVTER
ncbi:hypothetical protein [Grimontia marina]|uniref:hypothetical protein n=1 Tax=Grimontia marina TaxID=646534 RepID=UPI0012FAF800|nr:hypothetical protein [Grimontia marina]